MQARNCEERVLNLQKWRIEKAVPISCCIELCNGVPSDRTVTNVFVKGGEKRSYKESTIAAIEKACLGYVYDSAIKIPVEDVIRTQEDTVALYFAEVRKLRQTVERQAEIIRTLLCIGIICVFFFSCVALYDFLSHSTGFWATDSYGVWIVKVAFLAVITVLLSERIYALRKLKAKFLAEEQAAAESGI